jgi:hypothetical protein
MSLAKTASAERLTLYTVTDFGGLSLEAEIRTLCMLAPEIASQLRSLFAQSVVESCWSVAGASAGEALVGKIGDRSLEDRQEVYERITALLRGGSSILMRAVDQRFRIKVHRLYRVSMGLEMKRLAAH